MSRNMRGAPNVPVSVSEERQLDLDEKPLVVQLNWNKDDREGRFVLKNENDVLPKVSHLNGRSETKVLQSDRPDQFPTSCVLSSQPPSSAAPLKSSTGGFLLFQMK